MTSLTTHLVRRSVDSLQTSFRASSNEIKEEFPFPAWGITLVIATVMLLAFGQFAISYTYGEVVATLAMVEAPSSTAIVRTPPEDCEGLEHHDAPLLSNSEKMDIKESANHEILTVKQKALTSRFCAIRRHLQARGGRGSRFRGLGIYVVNSLLFSMIVGILSVIVGSEGPMFMLLEVGAYTLLAPIQLLWNHTIISEPTQKTAIQRMAPRSIIKKALLPTALYATISSIASQGFVHGWLKLRMIPASQPSGSEYQSFDNLPLDRLAPALIGLFFFLAVQFPAEIAIGRVRASLLSPEEEPIIPFDRSFNGQVVSSEAGGSGMLSLWQAYIECERQTRLRVLGVYAKVIGMQVVWAFLGALVLLGEMRLMMGPAFASYLSLDVILQL